MSQIKEYYFQEIERQQRQGRAWPGTNSPTLPTPPAAPNLATELFQQLDLTAVEWSDAGTGNFPKRPERPGTKPKPNGTLEVLTPTAAGLKKKRLPRFERKWESDPRDYWYRVTREVSKAHAEMGQGVDLFTHHFESEGAAITFINTTKTAHKRAKKKGQEPDKLVFQIYPYVTQDGNGAAAVVCSIPGGEPIPTSRTAAYNIFHELLNTPPEAKLNRHSQGYGQQWQGMKGDGRKMLAKKEIEAATGQKVQSVQIVTSKQEWELTDTYADIDLIPIDSIEAYKQSLLALTDDWKVRGGGSLDLAFRLLKQQCTQLRDTQSKGLYTEVGYSQADPTAEEWHRGEKTNDFLSPMPKEPAPIYLNGRLIQ